MSKLIQMLGAPGSGKSTLATDVHTKLKIIGKNSIFIPEVATDYIAEYGIPSEPIDQMVIFYKQLNKERMYIDVKDYIICDSSSMLNYFYFRQLFLSTLSTKNIAAINHIQKEVLKSINQWSYIFYIPPINNDNINDGVRFHVKEEILKIDKWIKSYLELENIPYIDLSNININDRTNYVLDFLK